MGFGIGYTLFNVNVGVECCENESYKPSFSYHNIHAVGSIYYHLLWDLYSFDRSATFLVEMLQHFLWNECKLLFYHMDTSVFTGPDPALALMKIRHIHLMLMNSLKNFNKVFSSVNLLTTIYAYFHIILHFVKSRFDEIKFSETSHHDEVRNFFMMFRTYIIYIRWFSFHNQFQCEVSFLTVSILCN